MEQQSVDHTAAELVMSELKPLFELLCSSGVCMISMKTQAKFSFGLSHRVQLGAGCTQLNSKSWSTKSHP